MSSVTLLQAPVSYETTAKSSSPTCQQCGADITYAAATAAAEDAQRRISELEAQVRILTGKATAAVDKLADYEDQLHQLKSTQSGSTNRPPSPHITTQPPSRPTSTATLTETTQTTTTTSKPPRLGRLTNLLRPPSGPSTPTHPPLPQHSYSSPQIHRPSSSASSTGTNNPLSNDPDPPSNDLLALLTQEQTLRRAAESKLQHTNQELEDLSAQLFTEANEMVAAERKARVKLEGRVGELERREGELERREKDMKGRVGELERRDREKRERLGELERRVGRVERVRGLLSGVGGS